MDQQHKLIPGEALIYEHADGVTYARYRDPPHNKIPRWIIGGDPDALSMAQGNLFSYSHWREMQELAREYPTLKKQLQKAITTYLLLKDDK